MITIEFIVIILCLLVGTRFGGMGLGLISGIGLFILSFVFGLQPGKPPVDVMLTILAVIGCAATLQTAGGLNVMMQFAERLLRKHPQHITLLAPFTTWMLTFLCGTGHVVYTMFPIIADIALKKAFARNGRWRWPRWPHRWRSPPPRFRGRRFAGLNSGCAARYRPRVGDPRNTRRFRTGLTVRRRHCGTVEPAPGKNLADDPEFQEKLKDPKQREFIYGGTETLMDQRFPKQAYWSTWIFFAGIAVVVLLGALPELRPAFEIKGKMTALSMNLVIQMMMLIAGAIMLMTCKVNASAISNGAVFKAGMVAIFSVFGVAWMSDTFFQAHLDELKMALEGVVKSHPWTYAIVLFLVSKLVNSQAAALTAVAPMGLMLGIDPKMLVAFFPASYGYFVLPTYPSDLACIGFDRSGTTRIGKFIINHSFILPGLIGVSCACVVSYLLVQTFF